MNQRFVKVDSTPRVQTSLFLFSRVWMNSWMSIKATHSGLKNIEKWNRNYRYIILPQNQSFSYAGSSCSLLESDFKKIEFLTLFLKRHLNFWIFDHCVRWERPNNISYISFIVIAFHCVKERICFSNLVQAEQSIEIGKFGSLQCLHKSL